MHNKCVSTSSTGAILSRSKSTTQSSVARPLSQSFAPLARVHTGPDSHTRTHPRVAWQPRSIVFLFWQPWSRKALDYPGIFKHCRINGYNLPQRKQITELRPNQSLSSPVPAPGIVGIKQALLRMSALGAFHIPQPGGSEFFWMQSPVAEATSLRAGAAGVQRSAPTQESLRHLVWEPGTLHRQTRGWVMHPPSPPRGKQCRTDASARGAACPGCPLSTSTYLDMEVSTDSEDG